MCIIYRKNRPKVSLKHSQKSRCLVLCPDATLHNPSHLSSFSILSCVSFAAFRDFRLSGRMQNLGKSI